MSDCLKFLKIKCRINIREVYEVMMSHDAMLDFIYTNKAKHRKKLFIYLFYLMLMTMSSLFVTNDE